MNLLTLENVQFGYPGTRSRKLMGEPSALGPIDLQLKCGLYALAGPNGSGKSTLLKLLAGILQPSIGVIHYYWGHHRIEHPLMKRYIGYVPQQISVYEHMTVVQYLTYLGKLKMIPKMSLEQELQQALSLVHLNGRELKVIEQLSTGERRRLMLAQSLLADPRILLMDEPFTGLDIEERTSLIELLTDLSASCIIIAAHHLLDFQASAFTDIIMMRKGQLISRVHTGEAIRALDGLIWMSEICKEDLPAINRFLEEKHTFNTRFGVVFLAIKLDRNAYHIRVYAADPAQLDAFGSEIIKNSKQMKNKISWRPASATLEDYYLYAII